MTLSAPETPTKPPLRAGGVILILLGLILLVFPGGCSLLFTIAAIAEKISSGGNNYGFIEIALVMSAIGFAVAAFGFWLIRVGLRLRRPPTPAAEDKMP